MTLILKSEKPPLREDETGAIRVGNSRVLLEIVIRAFQNGASPESIYQSILNFDFIRCLWRDLLLPKKQRYSRRIFR